MNKLLKALNLLIHGKFENFFVLTIKFIHSKWSMELYEYFQNNNNSNIQLEGLEIYQGTRKDISSLASIWPKNFFPQRHDTQNAFQLVKEEFDKSVCCYIGKYNDEVVHVSFAYDVTHWFNIPSIEFGKIVTSEKYRGKNITGIVLSHAIQSFDERYQFYVRIEDSNYSSMKSVEKIGFKNIGKLKTKNFFGRRKYIVV